MILHMLTTIDNPYNPFVQFDEWQQYDESSGYHSMQFLARVAITSDNLSEADQDLAMETAIDEIVQQNVNGMYKKVAAPSSTELAS